MLLHFVYHNTKQWIFFISLFLSHFFFVIFVINLRYKFRIFIVLYIDMNVVLSISLWKLWDLSHFLFHVCIILCFFLFRINFTFLWLFLVLSFFIFQIHIHCGFFFFLYYDAYIMYTTKIIIKDWKNEWNWIIEFQ